MRSLDEYRLIAVTGGAGWLGRRLVGALTEGNPALGGVGGGGRRVRCLVQAGDSPDDLRNLGAEIVAGDTRDPDACKALLAGAAGGLLVHLAGVIHPDRRTRSFQEVNVEGTATLLAAARTAGIRRLVAMSSNSPFGRNPSPDHVFTEDSPYNPYMGYGRSKWRMELLLRAAADGGDGPEIVIVRAPWFYGPGQPPRQTAFFTMIKNGRFPLMGKGGNRRSMGYVDSLALGILLAAANDRAAGQVYWLADARPYTMAEIVDTVKATLKADFGMQVAERNLSVPSAVSDLARLADRALQGVGLYHQKIHVLSEMNQTIACDIGKARRELGFEPIVDLREGMRRSIEWCLNDNQMI